MLVDQFVAAAAAARDFSTITQITGTLWQAHAAGALSDDEAQAAAEAMQARKATILAATQQKPVSAFPRRPKPHPRTPDRQRSLERRRRWAASGALPPQIAAAFTTSEQAVLAVLARQVQQGGTCSLPVDQIAALAGVCRSSAQAAIRQARALGLVHVRERRRRGLPSLTNVITVIDRSWSSWLKLSGRGVGFRNSSTTFFSVVNNGANEKSDASEAPFLSNQILRLSTLSPAKRRYSAAAGAA
jgi:hypothetical protein